jgi:excinuclease ABC subunit A
MNKKETIYIKGARVNNLKNIDVEIPRGKFVVITGVSGSGKSSLAFDTLYAEGQRRYVESLSSYARQFLGRMSKPEVDAIMGIPPAIAVEQKVKTRNSRSTVGTSTEIYDYLRMLFARIGKTFSPITGAEVKKHQTKDVLDFITSLPQNARVALLAPIVVGTDETMQEVLDSLLKQGFSRMFHHGQFVPLETCSQDTKSSDVCDLLIDRFPVTNDTTMLNRIADSIETAFYEGKGVCYVAVFDEEGKLTSKTEFSKIFAADGMVFDELTEHMFSFNNPLGACPRCEGFGMIIGVDEDLVVPNKTLSVYDDAVACWKGEKMSEDKLNLIKHADKFDFPIHKPYYALTPEQKKLLWTGNSYFYGINDFFVFLEQNQYKIQYRVMLSRYRGKTVCPVCEGSRLRKEALYVKISGKTIHDLVCLSVADLLAFFRETSFTDYERAVATRLLTEISNRLGYLIEVGLDYLTLNRLSNTLSGGESQRINLATSLGSSLVGSLYILDEPSIGLHPRNTAMLVGVLRKMQSLGNTVVVVEHDEHIMRQADWLIDIGPDAGRLGGEVVLEGNPALLLASHQYSDEQKKRSHTLRYLLGEETMPMPLQRRKWSNYLFVENANEHNLKDVSVKFPLNVLTVVTGVSGSGKSTLVRSILYASLRRHFGLAADRVGSFGKLSGSLHLVKAIEFVDQNPIGKSSRSNPCTYLKAYDEIRKLFAEQQFAKQMAFTAAHFSFNVPGGRCEECQGEGTITIPMQFMADVVLECEACHGKRFKPDVLEVKYRGVGIADVLDMTVFQAIEFFSEKLESTTKKIVKRLQPLQDVGLGYVKLGQASSTLSGGESQRVKLASFLSNESQEHTVFIFDEPTTGLHFSDIKTLMKAFYTLIDKGHTVIVIEHNVDVIRAADHIIDLGKEGGDAGGYVVFEGTPEEIKQCADSYTGAYL